MNKPPIYINNIDLAIEMKKAGFDKECVHSAKKRKYYITDNETIIICAYGVVIVEVEKTVEFDGKLYLPTLSEIELPEGVYITPYKIYLADGSEKSVFYCFDNNKRLFVKKLSGGRSRQKYFETELEARAYAWLWANQKKEVQNN